MALRLTDVEYSVALADDHAEDTQRFETLLWHNESGSWATHQVTPETVESGEYQVWQWGPRRLWDEAEDAYTWWDTHGRPDFRDFGVTVAKTGQSVWLNEAGNVLSNGTVSAGG